jgi:hypothetical protein
VNGQDGSPATDTLEGAILIIDDELVIGETWGNTVSIGACLLLCRRQVKGKMAEIEVTFHNEAEIRVQAQIFAGRTLVSTCVAGPGEIHILPAESVRYDIFFKNGATGWEIARQLDSEAKTLTLNHHKGRYVIT